MFRFAGAVGASPDRVRASLEALARRIEGPVAHAWFGAGSVHGGLLYAPQARPAIRLASAGDLFALVDGEIYATAARGAGALTENPAALLCEAWQGGGDVSAFDGVDAAAAFVLWDRSRAMLVAGRDCNGHAPLFHARAGELTIFAAETAPLLAASVRNDPDPRALAWFLAHGYCPAPWTFLRHVENVPPGHALVFDGATAPRLRQYHRPTALPPRRPKRETRKREIRNLLQEAIAARSSGGRECVLLSGGVDSALVLAGLVRLGRTPVACTFRYRDYEGRYNEDGAAARVAAHLGVGHDVIEIGPADVAGALPELVSAYGEPFTYGLHSFALRVLAGQGISGILTGVGPDRFGSAPIDRLEQVYERAPGPLRLAWDGLWPALDPAMRALWPRAARRMGELHYGAARGLPARFAVVETPPAIRAALFADRAAGIAAEQDGVRLLRALAGELAEEPAELRGALLGHRLFGAEAALRWNTVWSREAGLPVRHPFQDRRLQDYLLRLRGAPSGKPALRLVASETLLPEWVTRAPKLHQTIPIGAWMRGPLRDLLFDTLAPARIVRGGVFDPASVQALAVAHAAGRADHAWTLWSLMTATLWLEQTGAAANRRLAA